MTTGCNWDYSRYYYVEGGRVCSTNDASKGIQLTPAIHELVSRNLQRQIDDMQRKFAEFQQQFQERYSGSKRRYDEIKNKDSLTLLPLPSIQELEKQIISEKRPREGCVLPKVKEVFQRSAPFTGDQQEFLIFHHPRIKRREVSSTVTATERTTKNINTIKDRFFTYRELITLITELRNYSHNDSDELWKQLGRNVFKDKKHEQQLQVMFRKIIDKARELKGDLLEDDFDTVLRLLETNKDHFKVLTYIRWRCNCNFNLRPYVWTEEQEMQLVESYLKKSQMSRPFNNWKDISEEVDGRNNDQCKDKFIQQFVFLSIWSQEELLDIIKGYHEFREKEGDVWINICDAYFKKNEAKEYLRWPEQVKEKWEVMCRVYGQPILNQFDIRQLSRFINVNCYSMPELRENNFFLS